jgi:hypothetical protein
MFSLLALSLLRNFILYYPLLSHCYFKTTYIVLHFFFYITHLVAALKILAPPPLKITVDCDSASDPSPQALNVSTRILTVLTRDTDVIRNLMETLS